MHTLHGLFPPPSSYSIVVHIFYFIVYLNLSECEDAVIFVLIINRTQQDIILSEELILHKHSDTGIKIGFLKSEERIQVLQTSFREISDNCMFSTINPLFRQMREQFLKRVEKAKY